MDLDPSLDRAQRPRDCCRDVANLIRLEVAPDRYIEHCGCGLRHFVAAVDPVAIGLTGKGL